MEVGFTPAQPARLFFVGGVTSALEWTSLRCGPRGGRRQEAPVISGKSAAGYRRGGP
ncbi:hypothetical protein BDZ97DRAFT_1866879 [Flammula alnicola]|nr:hypothetical protein BDZ97DRAFT_1866879 [Flammula alnicola]